MTSYVFIEGTKRFYIGEFADEMQAYDYACEAGFNMAGYPDFAIEKSMALCEGRHSIPQATDGAIFPSVVNPLNVMDLFMTARDVLRGVDVLNLYVTGLTPALVAVLNACHYLNITVTLYHYDRDTGNYYPQRVL